MRVSFVLALSLFVVAALSQQVSISGYSSF